MFYQYKLTLHIFYPPASLKITTPKKNVLGRLELDHPQADYHASKRKKIELDHVETGPPSKQTKKTRAGPKSKQATQVEVVQLTRETV